MTTVAPPNGWTQRAPSLLVSAADAVARARPRSRVVTACNVVARGWGRVRRYVGSVTALSLFTTAGFVALPVWGGLVVAGAAVVCLELHVHVVNTPPPTPGG